jgi:hypothetical protein
MALLYYCVKRALFITTSDLVSIYRHHFADRLVMFHQDFAASLDV